MQLVLALSAVILLVACTTEEDRGSEPESGETVEADILGASGPITVGGRPSESEINRLARDGYRTVLDLRSFEEGTAAEAAAVKAAGMRYVQVPFRNAKSLRDPHFDEGRRWLRDATARPLHLHCVSGNRAGAIWLAHRVLDEGIDFEIALEEARALGLSKEALITKTRDYVSSKRR